MMNNKFEDNAKVVHLTGGISLTVRSAEAALEQAARVIERIGTTAVGDADTVLKAQSWLQDYFSHLA